MHHVWKTKYQVNLLIICLNVKKVIETVLTDTHTSSSESQLTRLIYTYF